RMDELAKHPGDLDRIRTINQALANFARLPLGLHLWKAQNIYVELGRKRLDQFLDRAEKGKPEAADLLEAFHRLGELLRVRLEAVTSRSETKRLTQLSDLGKVKLT
ncbi:MAG: hypothetical protein ACOCVM_06565, partial [Desulfovibrionaceae bacterium]